MNINNPLLDFTGLPRFNDIKSQHIEPALDYMLESGRKQIDGLIEAEVQPSWENFMRPMEDIADQLDKLWSPISHLNGVKDSDALRIAYEACIPKLTDYASELGQNAKLFSKFKQLKQSAPFSEFSNAQKRAIENALRDFRLSGVDLDAKSKARYRQITKKLSDLENKFSQNVLDATDSWRLHVEDEGALKGLPPMVVEGALQKAAQKGKSGWVFSLHAPSYIPFMTCCDSRPLREEMHRAYVTRASKRSPDGDKWDNSKIISQILKLRNEMAALLGFEDYASYSMETKMAASLGEVETFIRDLSARSKKFAQSEMDALKEFASKEYGIAKLEPWDMAWMSEKLKLHKFDFSEESLRSFFPLPKVLEGMFTIVGRLFGISIVEIPLQHKWNDKVQFFKITDESNQVRGYFYIDLFARDHKRGGAWMADCMSRRKTGESVQLPVAFLTCNFTEPGNDKPSLLTHDEVITLFHEFGHGLHHMLTRIDIASVSGISGVPWDAVELPSQFLENWCWNRESLDLISGHYETKEPISDDMLGKMQAAKNFQSAMHMQRQLEFSLFDLQIHRKTANLSAANSVRKILDAVREEVAVVSTPAFNCFENSFGHIFSGGYAAGYYSYKWAEVLSADAFSLFEEEGIFNQSTGRRFLRLILEKGGAEDPMDLFIQFRGRKPDVEALLRHSGLGLEGS